MATYSAPRCVWDFGLVYESKLGMYQGDMSRHVMRF